MSFDVSQIALNTSGAQVFTTDAHTIRRDDRPDAQMLVVTVGSLLLQVHDLTAAKAFATACRTAARFVPSTFPDRLAETSNEDLRRTPGILLSVEGAPSVHRVHGFGAAYGVPHVRIHLDRLLVRFFDLEALLSWVAGWEDVERRALRVWPEPDAFDDSLARERLHIAKTGQIPSRGRAD
jgi:hypothetical protein